MTTPQIIRTTEDLKALDQDTLLISGPDGLMASYDWASGFEVDPEGIFPLAILATGEAVRAARQALEKEQEQDNDSH